MVRNFRWDVFLSHSTRDKERVRKLAEKLRAARLRVWFDEWVIKPGDDIYASIEEGLEHSRTLVLCISQDAIKSDWVSLERNTTIFRDPQNKHRRFIPLMFERCKVPAVIGRLARVDWTNESRESLTKIVEACRPTKSKPTTSRSPRFLTPPTGAMTPNSPLYIEREADAYAMAAAQQPAETIIIKAPRQMGKSSLLIRYMSECRSRGAKTVFIDLASRFTNADISEYSTFLSILAREMWEQLGQLPNAAPPAIERQPELTNYVERSLLRAVDGTVLLAFDEMDRVLGRPYQDDFFSMLRYWHDQRADPSTLWHRLGIAIAISTEPYLFIQDVVRSPFNVGLNVELRLFNERECQILNQLYRARLKRDELKQLMSLLNGHPHLTHLAFYAVCGPNPVGFQTVLQKASAKDGPFSSHLRALEYKLIDETGDRILAVMKQIVEKGKVANRNDFYRLHSAGLAREDGGRVVPSNELYARFFREL